MRARAHLGPLMTSRAVDLAPLFADWLQGRSVLPDSLLEHLGLWARDQLAFVRPGAVVVAAIRIAGGGHVAVATSKSTHLAFAWAHGTSPAAAVRALRPRLGKARQDTADRSTLDWLTASAPWAGSRDDEIAIRCLARAYLEPVTKFGKTSAMLHDWADRPWTVEELLDAIGLPEEPQIAPPPEPAPVIPPGHVVIAVADLERIAEEALVTTLRWARLHATTRGRLVARDAAARLWKRSATVLRDRWLQALRERAAVDAALARVTKERDDALALLTENERERAEALDKLAVLRTELADLRRHPRKTDAKKVPEKPAPPKTRPPSPAPAPLSRVQVPPMAGAPRVVTAKGPQCAAVNDGGIATFTPASTETAAPAPGPKRAPSLPTPEDAHRRLQDRLREERERQRLRSGFYDEDRPAPEEEAAESSEDDDEESEATS